MTRMNRRQEAVQKGQESASYSLWTAPPRIWQSPIERDLPTADLKTEVSQLELKSAEDDDQTKAFKTPVTPDVLSRPTQS